MENLEKTVVMPSIKKGLEKRKKNEKEKKKQNKIKLVLASLVVIGSSFGLFLFMDHLVSLGILDNLCNDYYDSSVFSYMVL